jgi:hypothetical protein
LSAKGTPYVVAAGVYEDKATIAELSKLSSKKKPNPVGLVSAIGAAS